MFKLLGRNKWRIMVGLALVAVIYYYWNYIREPDWRASAIEDVAFMHSVILNDHPGAADIDNPDFLVTLEAAEAFASELARGVDSAAGYFYATRAFTMPFKDAHLAPQFFRSFPRSRNWPGFFVAVNDEGKLVVFTKTVEDMPPVGAELLSCEGKTPETLFQERIEPFLFLSWLPSTKAGDWPWILIDTGNPFLKPLQACEFLVAGEPKSYSLNWKPLEAQTLKAFTDEIDSRFNQNTELRFVEGNVAWISIASFFDSGEEVSEELSELIADINNQHQKIENSDALVIDVRGNLGGASAAGYEVAKAIWGKGFIADRIPYYTSTDWRSSENNLERIDSAMFGLRLKFGSDSEIYSKVLAIKEGMQKAQENGQLFFVQQHNEKTPSGDDPRPLPANIYFLTGPYCVSACLDFADLMKSINGVTHIGWETAGDTFYLEVATAELPSGIGQLVYPTAVHRGRDRGVNVTLVPEEPLSGPMSDTAAIIDWINSKD